MFLHQLKNNHFDPELTLPLFIALFWCKQPPFAFHREHAPAIINPRFSSAFRSALFAHGLKELAANVGQTAKPGDLIKFLVYLIKSPGLKIMPITGQKVFRNLRRTRISVFIKDHWLILTVPRCEYPVVGLHLFTF